MTAVATAINPSKSATTSRVKWWMLLPVLAVALLATLGWSLWRGAAPSDISPAAFYTVQPVDMDVKLIKDGELQAVNNIDVVSMVEAQNTIQQLVKEGTTVKKGDTLVVMDSSQIKQKIEDALLDVQKGEADLTTAREMKEIQESWNSAAMEGAQVMLTLAQLDEQQYERGSYPQLLANAKTDLEMAQITLKNRQEDLDQTNKLFTKGFVTAADVKKAELDVTTARNSVAKAQTALEVLTKYTHPMDQTSKRNATLQAEQKLLRTKRENTSNLAQKNAEVLAKEQALAVLKRRLQRAQEQFANCTIKAPADGLVLYGTSTDRNAQNPLQEGSQVRERQLLLRLPDTNSMKAVVRILEAQVPHLEIGQRAKVRIAGIAQPIGAQLSKISVLADNSQRFWNPDLKEYPVDLDLDHTPPNLKPGGGVSCEILLKSLKQVLAVPLDAIYSEGNDRYVFVPQGDKVKPVAVSVGESTETMVEVTDGLSANMNVLRLQIGQGRQLLEKAGVKSTSQPTKP